MTLYTYNLAASADDAYQASGTVTVNGVTILLNAGTRYGGLSFPTAANPIPQGQSLTQAILYIYAANTSSDDPTITIRGHKVVNSTQFAGTASEISNRYNSEGTTATISHEATNIGTAAYGIDVTAAMQELVNQAGWTSSSRATFLLMGSAASTLQFRAWDNGSSIPYLTVEWATAASVAGSLVRAARLSTKVGGLLCGI